MEGAQQEERYAKIYASLAVKAASDDCNEEKSLVAAKAIAYALTQPESTIKAAWLNAPGQEKDKLIFVWKEIIDSLYEENYFIDHNEPEFLVQLKAEIVEKAKEGNSESDAWVELGLWLIDVCKKFGASPEACFSITSAFIATLSREICLNKKKRFGFDTTMVAKTKTDK